MAIDRRENAGDFYPGGRAVAIRRAPSPTVSPVASPSQPGADAGDYYPGGKTISTRPVATGGDMKHSEFAEMEPLPERFTENQMRTKLNAVIGLLKGSAATLVVFAALAALGDALTVQKAPKGDIYNDEPVVTNVTFNAAGLATSTNVVTALGQTTTNTVVYSSTPLLIRAQTDADGVKRYRLIDLTP